MKQLKSHFNKEYITLLSATIKNQHKEFDASGFEGAVFDSSWDELELKQRVRHIAKTLHLFLPQNYQKSLGILKKTITDIGIEYYLQNFIFSDFVEVYGLDDYDASIDALKHFTQYSTAEYAIRAFITKDVDKTMTILQQWAKDENEHIRRLASEGCRPRLPWAKTLEMFKKEPSKIIPILEILKNDDAKYVQKSVANNLNDISKDNENFFIQIAKNWYGHSKNTNWIVKHASRTLLKKGDMEMMQLFGFLDANHVEIKNFQLSKSINIGDNLLFSFDLISKQKLGKLRVEYAIYFLKKDKSYSKKLFKIGEYTVDAKEMHFEKKHHFKKLTTRKFYEGLQKIEIVVNGVGFGSVEFELR